MRKSVESELGKAAETIFSKLINLNKHRRSAEPTDEIPAVAEMNHSITAGSHQKNKSMFKSGGISEIAYATTCSINSPFKIASTAITTGAMSINNKGLN